MLRRVDDAPARTLDVDWPLENPALASELSADGSGTALLVDGHGHIYVFPLVRDPIDGRYPVDVFDASGDRLFAGWIALNEWQDALGDFVYRLEESEEDDEIVAIRYALVEPFE